MHLYIFINNNLFVAFHTLNATMCHSNAMLIQVVTKTVYNKHNLDGVSNTKLFGNFFY